MDAAAPASHLEYKLVSCSKEDENYRCSQLNNHSITSGSSSNHTELIRAYEFGRNFHLNQNLNPNLQMQKGFYYKGDHTEDEDEYTNNASNCSVMSDETPTDPGIRRFTKSPPRPNETRTAACFAVGHKINNEESAEDDDDGEDDDGSAQVEDAGDSDSESVLTASPASSEPELSSPSTPTNDQQPADVFAAIPRNRSRHPSWAQTRMTQMYSKQQQLHQNRRRELDLVKEIRDRESIDQWNQREGEETEEERESKTCRFKKERRKSISDAKKMSNPLHPCHPSSSSSHHHLLSSHPPSSSSPAHLLRSVTHFESTPISSSSQASSRVSSGGVFPLRELHLFSLISCFPVFVSSLIPSFLSVSEIEFFHLFFRSSSEQKGFSLSESIESWKGLLL
jgi:hypothetical protein